MLCLLMPAPVLRVQDGQETAPAASSGTQVETIPRTSDTPGSKAGSLAKYIPAEKLNALVEFQGLDHHAGAWKQSSAARILAETNTGSMLEEILDQLLKQFMVVLPGNGLNSQEQLALIKHLLGSGFIYGVQSEKNNPVTGGMVLVFRDAFLEENKAIFARLLVHQMTPGGKPTLTDKPGGRRIAVMPTAAGAQSAWWVEDRRDLVICVPDLFVNQVINSLDGKTPNAEADPRRAKLSQSTAGIEPIGWAFADLKALSSSAQATTLVSNPLPGAAGIEALGLDQVRSFQMKWSIEGKAMRTDVDIEAPAPRAGLLGFLNQRGFETKEIPSLPENFDSFGMMSLNTQKMFKDFQSIASKMGQQEMLAQVDAVIKDFEKVAKLDLQKDLLGNLGPYVTFHTQPQKKAGLPAMLGAVNPLLGGAQIPRLTVLFDIKDTKAANKSLTKLMAYANKQLATMALPGGNAPEAAPGQGRVAGRNPPAGPSTTKGGAGKGAGSNPKTVQSNQIRMTASDPLTYQFSLPEPLSTMLGVKPTAILGNRRLILAISPDLATQSYKLEKETAETETPSGEFGEAVANLPGKLIYLQASDPRETLPKAIAGLPLSLNATFNQLFRGSGPPAMVPSGNSIPPGAGPGGLQGANPTNPQEAASPFKIEIDPSKLPSAESIRPLLFPGASAVSVDDSGVHWVSRQAFFDVNIVNTSFLAGFLQGFQRTAGAKAGPGSELTPGGPFPPNNQSGFPVNPPPASGGGTPGPGR